MKNIHNFQAVQMPIACHFERFIDIFPKSIGMWILSKWKSITMNWFRCAYLLLLYIHTNHNSLWRMRRKKVKIMSLLCWLRTYTYWPQLQFWAPFRQIFQLSTHQENMASSRIKLTGHRLWNSMSIINDDAVVLIVRFSVKKVHIIHLAWAPLFHRIEITTQTLWFIWLRGSSHNFGFRWANHNCLTKY